MRGKHTTQVPVKRDPTAVIKHVAVFLTIHVLNASIGCMIAFALHDFTSALLTHESGLPTFASAPLIFGRGTEQFFSRLCWRPATPRLRFAHFSMAQLTFGLTLLAVG